MSAVLTKHPEIEVKAQQIGDMIKRSMEMAVFKQAEQDLQTDSEAQALMAQLQATAEEEEINEVLSRLEALDVVRRFTVAQENLSEVVTHITTILAATVSDRLDILNEDESDGLSCANCPGASLCTGGGTGTSDACSNEPSSCSA